MAKSNATLEAENLELKRQLDEARQGKIETKTTFAPTHGYLYEAQNGAVVLSFPTYDQKNPGTDRRPPKTLTWQGTDPYVPMDEDEEAVLLQMSKQVKPVGERLLRVQLNTEQVSAAQSGITEFRKKRETRYVSGNIGSGIMGGVPNA